MSVNRDASKPDGKRIEAQKFDTPPPLAGQKPELTPSRQPATPARWWHSQLNLMMCVFVLIAIAAFLFAKLAPPPELEVDAEAWMGAAPAATVGGDDVAPWDENRRAQARADSQDILSNLLASKKMLQAKKVENWAPTRFQQALDLAQKGDDFYKLQEYQKAIDTYQAALDRLDSLFDELPQLVEDKVASGMRALDAGKTRLAEDAFNEAIELDADNINALNGLQRVSTLDRVLDLMQIALAAEQSFLDTDELSQLDMAISRLDQVLALDPAFSKADVVKQRISNLQQDKRFRQAMSEGFAALFAGRYQAANSAFANALEIRPQDPTASSAFRQSLASNKTSSLQSLLNLAVRHETNERWHNALESYQVVLQRDPSLVAAKLGQIRSRARAQLDNDLRNILADPLALSKAGQSVKATNLLAEAKAIRNPGERLKQQIAALEQGMQAVTIDINVQLISDRLTDVSLRKVGASKISLGKFDSKKLTLKPGRYVLTGVRLGFRDVRKEIALQAQHNAVQKFSISCNEPVGVASGLRDNEQT